MHLPYNLKTKKIFLTVRAGFNKINWEDSDGIKQYYFVLVTDDRKRADLSSSDEL